MYYTLHCNFKPAVTKLLNQKNQISFLQGKIIQYILADYDLYYHQNLSI